MTWLGVWEVSLEMYRPIAISIQKTVDSKIDRLRVVNEPTS